MERCAIHQIDSQYSALPENPVTGDKDADDSHNTANVPLFPMLFGNSKPKLTARDASAIPCLLTL